MRKLLPSQEADLALVIAQSGLTKSEFELTAVDGEFAGYVSPRDTPGLVHESGAWFGIARHMEARGMNYTPRDVGFLVAFMPGSEKHIEEHGRLDWPGVLNRCRMWLRNLMRELMAPSFAAVLESAATDSNAKSDERFDPEEAQSINRALGELHATLKEMREIDTKHQEYISKEFSALREELATMRRGRWRKMAMGAVLNMAMTSVIPPDMASGVWARIEQALSSASSILPPGSTP